MIEFDEDKQKRKISDLLKREEEELVQLLSAKYGIEYIDLTLLSINTDALRHIDEKVSRENKIVAYALIDKRLKIAARNPESPKVKEILDEIKKKGFEPILSICSTASLEKSWSAYKDLSFAYETKAGSLEVSSEEISDIIQKTKDLPTVISLLENILSMKKSYRISRILETLLAGAFAIDASDVHIEPEEKYIRLRYRLDGVLLKVIDFDIDTYNLLLSRIKLLSGLKLNIKKDSQDGRFSVHVNNEDMEIRTSVLPGAYGESIVMRLLNPKNIGVPLEELGIPDKLLGILIKEIDKPNGMILTTGPTGSGKTTTLYAFIKKVYGPTVKIITIEDPVEYHLPGIVQTQVNDKGYTFLEGLRAAVRQDPDIIMIGEIRDSETANIAINSALTGHLVFSTLHTNDAAGTFPRLMDLGVNPKIFASAISIAMAQRLVRRLCSYCKKEIILEGKNKEKVDKVLDTIYDKDQLPKKEIENGKIWQAIGCKECNQTGYKGRIGIYEGIMMNEEIEKATEFGGNNREIALAAKNQGILTMEQDGIIKVLKGITSIEELERVVEIKE